LPPSRELAASRCRARTPHAGATGRASSATHRGRPRTAPRPASALLPPPVQRWKKAKKMLIFSEKCWNILTKFFVDIFMKNVDETFRKNV
jgi:hypothetical protein